MGRNPSRRSYGGDPTIYQLRDMQRRLTAAEKANIRAGARIRSLQFAVNDLQDNLKIVVELVTSKKGPS